MRLARWWTWCALVDVATNDLGDVWGAIWVGGESRRMGGQPKGLLLAPDGVPIVERTLELMRLLLPRGNIVLAGTQPAYAHLGVHQVPDNPTGVGPIGGLCAVLERAAAAGAAQLVAVSCDLPYLRLELLQRLLTHAPEAWVVAPRAGLTKWQPLYARYRVEPALAATRAVLANGERSLQRVFELLAERRVPLPTSDLEQRQLDDWDSPNDIPTREG